MIPIYSPITFGSSSNSITFNDEASFNANLVDYIFKARRRFADKREIRQSDTPIPDRPGVNDYQTLIGKEYYVIEGTLYGRTESALYTGMEILRKATSPAVTQDDAESDYGYLPLKWTENSDKQLWLKPLYVEIPETRKSANKPAFRIFFKIKYPFIESQDTHTTSLKPATVVAGTGIQIPSTGLEIPTGGIGISASSGTGNGLAHNFGDYRSYPTFNITAPINYMRITNGATNKYIEFNYNLSTGTANITISENGVTAETSSGVNLLQYLTAGSDIENFYLKPGDNQLTLTATSIGEDADVVCSWADSWPL